ncbi:hypothetical protein C1701_19170 [Actinoalloteichus sp. AHMU CJ021]|uniref:arsenate reductase/protein-tyrosine-phosphatase family protein n=1 Tax=Actinoalloteichus TaxID=65496 RepID=UPI0004AAE7ED|nr:hypothetical protein [Actinoalloteichus caeruleus]AUS80106.1 hypothetical protein C1701_19170 [Actinoalloteichus sp. AHMU CJ021]
MRILFVCTGNTCRSPMAAAITEAVAARRSVPVRVSSAGLRAETLISPDTTAMLQRRGIDPGPRPAVQVTPHLVEQADLVLGATRAHHDALRAEVPTAAGRIHVWADFVARAAALPPQPDLDELCARLAEGEPLPDTDLVDPAGRGRAAYETAAAQIDELAEGLLDVLGAFAR